MLNVVDIPDVIEYKLSDETIKSLEKTFDECIANKELLVEELSTSCTVNGIQTKNVINFIDQKSLNEIYQNANDYIKKYYNCIWRGFKGYNTNTSDSFLAFYRFVIDYMHMIRYDSGHQSIHNHSGIEDYTFIIYLNDSDGITKIYYKDSFINIKSERAKLVIFDSTLWHEGLECTDTRKILVGSVKFIHKVWN